MLRYRRRSAAVRRRGLALAPALAVLLLLPSVALGAPASSEPKRPSVALATSVSWAYGGNHSVSASGATRNGSFELRGAFGFAVVLNESPGPGGQIQLAAARTMGASYTLDYCSPSCGHPTFTATVSYRALEQLRAFATLTRSGSVWINGSSQPALGLVNESVTLADAVAENDTLVYHGPLHERVGSSNLTLVVNATLSVLLSPSLGIIPVGPIPGESWNASASFAASGSWGSRDTFQRTNLLGLSTSGGTALSFNVVRSGNVSVEGADLGNLTLADGEVTGAMELSVPGPLHLRDGVFLMPGAADLFGAAVIPNAPGGNGTLGETSTIVDFSGSSAAHIGLLASASTFAATGSDPSAGAPTPPLAMVPATEGSGPVTVQAQPESVSQGQGQASCLASAGCLTGPSGPGVGSPGALRPLVGLALVGLAVAVVVGVVVVTRRPKVPPRPNEALYPPVSATAPRGTGPGEPPSPSPPPDEDDPLGHLW